MSVGRTLHDLPADWGGGIVLAVNLKAYLGLAASERWCRDVREIAMSSSAVVAGRVTLAVLPAMALLASAVAWFEGSPVLVGAQDVSVATSGPNTGETTARLVSELGCRLALTGHAERRRIGDTDEVVAVKARVALDAGLTPIVCVGEQRVMDPAAAARQVTEQLARSLSRVPPGRLVVAYEPVWAIGADAPAGAHHTLAVCDALDAWLKADPGRTGSMVIYGGSAGPAMVSLLGGAMRGLFLGRSVHDPATLAAMVSTIGRSGRAT